MPPLECGEHLIEHLWAAGPSTGEGALTHGELRAYQDNTGVELTEWEVSTLRRLSIAYLNESHAAKKRDCPPPWKESAEAPILSAVDARNSIRALAAL